MQEGHNHHNTPALTQPRPLNARATRMSRIASRLVIYTFFLFSPPTRFLHHHHHHYLLHFTSGRYILPVHPSHPAVLRLGIQLDSAHLPSSVSSVTKDDNKNGSDLRKQTWKMTSKKTIKINRWKLLKLRGKSEQRAGQSLHTFDRAGTGPASPSVNSSNGRGKLYVWRQMYQPQHYCNARARDTTCICCTQFFSPFFPPLLSKY